MRLALCAWLCLSATWAFASTLKIDGSLDEAAWQDAAHYSDFVVTQPFSGAKPNLNTEVRVLSLPEGLALGFICEQPPSVRRIKPHRPRDAPAMNSDQVYAFIDFDGTGQRAYEFNVTLGNAQRDGTITNETVFNRDWDGRWQSAVHEEKEFWTAEILIPWSTVPMRDMASSEREIAVQFGRFIMSRGERNAWPSATFDRARFVSEFEHMHISVHKAATFDVLPYVSERFDIISGRAETAAGVDIFYKPNNQFQLAAAIKPDFGQVESDDLVVNFDAIEVFLSDKRPFFTENQGLFDLRMPRNGEGQFLYTRRVGGPSDDNTGRPANINAALKITGSAGGFDYGTMLAQEEGSFGRTFLALRALRASNSKLSIGYLGTYTDHPGLDRSAFINAIDWRAKLRSTMTLDGILFGSHIAAGNTLSGNSGSTSDGYGMWARGLYSPSDHWQGSLIFTYLDKQLDFNDFGYMPRNNLSTAALDVAYRDSVHAEKSGDGAVTWRLNPMYRANATGDPLQHTIIFSRSADRRSGGTILTELRYDPPGVDDLISRGNGNVNRHGRFDIYQFYEMPQLGAWKPAIAAWWFQEGIHANALQFETDIRYQFSDELDLALRWFPRWSPDWLIWQQDNLLARYHRSQIDTNLQLNWFPAQRHELRLKVQWFVIHANQGEAYRIVNNGDLARTNEAINDLAVSNFAAQLRYRYEFAPQRELYVVYGRGGYVESDHASGIANLFFNATNLRDADQALVKVRWLF